MSYLHWELCFLESLLWNVSGSELAKNEAVQDWEGKGKQAQKGQGFQPVLALPLSGSLVLTAGPADRE